MGPIIWTPRILVVTRDFEVLRRIINGLGARATVTMVTSDFISTYDGMSLLAKRDEVPEAVVISITDEQRTVNDLSSHLQSSGYPGEVIVLSGDVSAEERATKAGAHFYYAPGRMDGVADFILQTLGVESADLETIDGPEKFAGTSGSGGGCPGRRCH